MAAAGGGHAAIVRALIAAGAQLDRRNAQGQRAIAVAQARGHADAARALLIAQNTPKRADAPDPEG
jgi:ankyrin repeat protein